MDTPSSSSEVYRSLRVDRKEIRLLVVKPGRGDEVLQCAFISAFLQDKSDTPPYETISYVWGEPAKQAAQILLHDLVVEVPASSERVVRHMRLPDRERNLWIDAVCIDQANIDERSSQVAFMADVYRSGTRNLIWLGEGDRSTAQAINSIQALNVEMCKRTDNYTTVSELFWNPNNARSSAQTPAISVNETALFHFYSNEWFRRLWVFQEVALSAGNLCFCGSHVIDLLSVLRAARWIRFHRLFYNAKLLQSTREAGSMWRYVDEISLKSHPIRTPMHHLLTTFRELAAFREEDHVFGLLGLYQKLSKLTKTPVVPDYRKSLPALMRDITVYTIREEKSLDCLSDVSQRGDNVDVDSAFPSWVPHWHKKRESKQNYHYYPTWSSAAGSSLLDTNEALQEADNGTLLLRGYVVDRVHSCTSMRAYHVYSLKEMKRVLIKLRAWMQDLQTRSSEMPRTDESLAMTLLAGEDMNRQPIHPEQAAVALQRFSAWLPRSDSMPTYHNNRTGQESADDIAAAKFVSSFWSVCRHRRIFDTVSLGTMGLGPNTVQEGDVLVILFGCRHPAILREQGVAGGKEFQFIGFCYVYDLMDGRAYREAEEAGRESVVSKIR